MEELYNYDGGLVNIHGCLTDYNTSCSFPFMDLGQRLQKAREHAGRVAGSDDPLPQGILAARSGVKQQTISAIETGRIKETAAVVPLAVACGVRSEWLANESGPMLSNHHHDPDVLALSMKIQALPTGARHHIHAVVDLLSWDRRTERRKTPRQ